MTTPEPGIYENIPFETYRAWDAMNASTLVKGMQSMRALKCELDDDKPDNDTPAKRFGRAVHCRLFEPKEFGFRFPEKGRCVGMTKPARKGDQPKRCTNVGKYIREDGEWVCGTHGDESMYEPRDFLVGDDAKRIERIRDNILEDDEIKHIRRFPGGEVSAVFDYCGVRCKARYDKLITGGGGFVIDPKALDTEDFGDEAFERELKKRKYVIKASFYLIGVKQLLNLDAEFWWIFYQPNLPHDIATVRMREDDYMVGSWEVRRLLRRYAECCESGKWPGAYSGLVQHVGLSQWEHKKYASMDLSE